METFRAFSAWHYAMLLAIAVVVASAIVVRRQRPADAWSIGPIERSVAYGFLAIWIASFVWLRFSRYYDPLSTYPLQMCHWCAVVAALSIVRPYRALRAIA